MAHTYSQIYVHVVHSTQKRQPIIGNEFKGELCKYITGIVKKKGQRMIAINCTSDHIHYFIALSPDVSISDLVRDIKHFSSCFINEKKLCRTKFQWQEGFGAFSNSHSQIDGVVRYIESQEEHHRKYSFQEEYLKILRQSGVGYELKYVFD